MDATTGTLSYLRHGVARGSHVDSVGVWIVRAADATMTDIAPSLLAQIRRLDEEMKAAIGMRDLKLPGPNASLEDRIDIYLSWPAEEWQHSVSELLLREARARLDG